MTVGSSETAVFYVPETDPDDISVHTKCEVRVWVYILLFCIAPVTIGSICCFIIWKVCDRSGKVKPMSEIRPSVRSVSSKPTDRTPFNKCSNQSPPSYEEAVQKLA